MKILSIDTSSNICSIAILEDKNLIKEINLDNGLTHSESLMPTIEQILRETGLNLQGIDLLICDKGPGSFTGIRIGISTIMAFSDSLNMPACGVSSLEALAYNSQKDGIICTLIDAKNSNCYCGIYELSGNDYTQLSPHVARHIDSILNNLKKYNSPITFIGDGAIANEDLLRNEFPNCIISDNNEISAYKLGLAGLQTYLSGNYENIKPLYLRKSQAERVLEEKSNENN